MNQEKQIEKKAGWLYHVLFWAATLLLVQGQWLIGLACLTGVLVLLDLLVGGAIPGFLVVGPFMLALFLGILGFIGAWILLSPPHLDASTPPEDEEVEDEDEPENR